MIVLYSYPELFGVADNNGYGLKVIAFMRLAGVPFSHEHIFDSAARVTGGLAGRGGGGWPCKRRTNKMHLETAHIEGTKIQNPITPIIAKPGASSGRRSEVIHHTITAAVIRSEIKKQVRPLVRTKSMAREISQVTA